MSDTSEEKKNDKLKFVRIFTPMHVPKKLIEQVKHRHYTVDEWYAYLQAICMQNGPNGPQLNPYCLLYSITNENYEVAGVLWCEIHPLDKVLVIQTYSLMPEYWRGAESVKLLADQAKEIQEKCKLKSIYWISRHPRYCEKHGFKRSRDILMEFKGGDHGEDIIRGHDDDEHPERPAEGIHGHAAGGTGG